MSLTPIQNEALCLLAAGYSRDEVAGKTGVSKSTINRWVTQPDFKTMLRNAVIQVYDAAIAELVSGSREAAKELKSIITDPDTPKRVKVSAIQVLLTTAAKAKESALEERLEAIETALDGNISSED
ncbi:helix-turn-helix domain-containing protein [Nostoc parmelioides]|uniref:Helix-turn-helix domain-containing protein n=1 Tax=Nostoc parmelioides FACHB-3921 TaxID=2692909 RepID=A0ABR8BN92_9NOSO|nr:helix-turn-helix domain-containing protein [Nostoc parmelioides]MBD2255597.1 helix-turn-helix domain-containing protein [Nostoc parmelioides FACHB-3921]